MTKVAALAYIDPSHRYGPFACPLTGFVLGPFGPNALDGEVAEILRPSLEDKSVAQQLAADTIAVLATAPC